MEFGSQVKFWLDMTRSSRAEVVCKKSALRNFAKFTGKYICQSLFFNEVASLSLWDRCFPVSFAKFIRSSFFLQNSSGACFCMTSSLQVRILILSKARSKDVGYLF